MLLKDSNLKYAAGILALFVVTCFKMSFFGFEFSQSLFDIQKDKKQKKIVMHRCMSMEGRRYEIKCKKNLFDHGSAERGDAGMNGYLSKPTELEKRMDLLVSLVEKKEK